MKTWAGVPIRPVRLSLTEKEMQSVYMCLKGEVENDDGHHGDYMNALRRVMRKLEKP